jgi:Ca2+-binding EF-hand superfamily protein
MVMRSARVAATCCAAGTGRWRFAIGAACGFAFAAAASAADSAATPLSPAAAPDAHSWLSRAARAVRAFRHFASGAPGDDEATLALCAGKAPDTPSFLVPYYLRDTRSRYTYYAKSRDANKRKRMSPADFLSAMLALPDPLRVGSDGPVADDGDGKNETSGERVASALAHFARFFNWADADGDGSISYREFAFLANILAVSLNDYRGLFRMFDADDKGGLTLPEFREMLKAIGDERMRPRTRSGVVRAMFLPEEHARFLAGAERPLVRAVECVEPAPGAAGKPGATNAGGAPAAATVTVTRMQADKVPVTAVVTFERFAAVVAQLERLIAEAEFRLRAATDHAATKEQFGAMILSSIHGRHLPYFLVDNLRRLAASAPPGQSEALAAATATAVAAAANPSAAARQSAADAAAAALGAGAVTLDTYLLFSEMIRRAGDVASALQLFAAAGYTIRAADLKRALDRTVVLSRPVTLEEAELFVLMFDANADGSLHVDEFVSILRARASYAGVLASKKEFESLFVRLAKCTSAEVSALLFKPDEDAA